MWLRRQRLDVTVYGFPSGMLVALRTGGFEERFVRIGFGSDRFQGQGGERASENSRRRRVTKKEEVDAHGFEHIHRDYRDRDAGCFNCLSGTSHPTFDHSIFNVESSHACCRKRRSPEEARKQSCHTS
jgi:hypothetical protein